jgi:SMC interacting uncharacterized protein involved in chromosome segregation
MSEERLRKDINRLKLLTNGCIPEYHQDIENVLDRLEQYKFVLDEIRELLNETFVYGDEWHWDSGAIRDYLEDIEKLLDKVKE